MKLTFLGTGAGIPSKQRNVSSLALNFTQDNGIIWLFDCGEATQHQILNTSIRPRKIEKIFITHLHGDHIFGLPGLLGSRSFLGGDTRLSIYGPIGINEFIMTSLKVSGTHIKYPLEIIEIEEGIIFEDDQYEVTAGKLEHGLECFGYRIVEKDKPGTLLVNELAALGVKPGPIFKQIKEGNIVTLESGIEIDGKKFVGPPIRGNRVTVLGDTRKCKAAINLAYEVDVLIHEATFGAQEHEHAYDYYHSTSVQAAEIAKEAGVKRLLLNHISSRYQGEMNDHLLEAAQKVFSNTELAFDFSQFDI